MRSKLTDTIDLHYSKEINGFIAIFIFLKIAKINMVHNNIIPQYRLQQNISFPTADKMILTFTQKF